MTPSPGTETRFRVRKPTGLTTVTVLFLPTALVSYLYVLYEYIEMTVSKYCIDHHSKLPPLEEKKSHICRKMQTKLSTKNGLFLRFFLYTLCSKPSQKLPWSLTTLTQIKLNQFLVKWHRCPRIPLFSRLFPKIQISGLTKGQCYSKIFLKTHT